MLHRVIAIHFTAVLVVGLAHSGSVLAADATWTGEWVTDFGKVTLTQDGSRVQGRYGDTGTIEGTRAGRELTIEWREGRSSGTGTLTIDTNGRSFRGSWKGAGGGGIWRGWRSDPDAARGRPADFSGDWLSSFGTLVLEQKGATVTGRYGSQGYGTVEGTVRGARLELVVRRLSYRGTAWFELTPTGDALFGLSDGETKWLAIRAPGFERDVKPKAGAIVKGISGVDLCYFLRAPKGWRKGKKTDAVILLHGSNWTTAGMVAVTARTWPDLADRFAIVGIQGDRWVDQSTAESPRHNYSYVNWMGRSTYEGYPHTDRESPTLLHETILELKERHGFERLFVVGHSQGGFVAFLLHMHYPETFAGVAPMACGLLMQAEPDVFDDEKLRAAQRATPLAMVHGTRDAQWGVKTGAYQRDRFLSHGFPALRFFTAPVGHGYDFHPVGDALRWMDALSTDDAKTLLAFAERRAKEGGWRDVAAALLRADAIGARAKFKAVEAKLDAAAERDAASHLAAIKKNENGEWVDAFLEWKEQFEFAPAAAKAMRAFNALRKKHDAASEPFYIAARQAFNARNPAKGWAKYQELVDRYYACSRIKIIKRWMAERK